jgi:6-pyruvoyltetrahydropterin/6-carboxytetrahydropterin synthase
MYEIGVVAQFEAAHRLRGDFGPATRAHGHTYRVEVTVRGPALREDGTLCDLGILQQAVDAAVRALHYRDLDELDAFAGRNTTAEAVARHIHDQVAPTLTRESLSQLAVRVWESPQAFAGYEGDLDT